MMDPNEYEGPDYDDWDEWYAEEAENRAFCDNYTDHDNHAYRALNGNTYQCPGYEADETGHTSAYYNEEGEPLMTASQARFEAYLDEADN